MDTLGNTELLKLRKVGYFASSKISILSVLPTLDWAAEIAKREDIAVISGFRSKLEREVLKFLLRGRCGIIVSLGRSIYKAVPSKFKEAFDSDRILFVSNLADGVIMTSKRSNHKANVLAASIADELVFSSLCPDSSLFPLSQTNKPVTLM